MPQLWFSIKTKIFVKNFFFFGNFKCIIEMLQSWFQSKIDVFILVTEVSKFVAKFCLPSTILISCVRPQLVYSGFKRLYILSFMLPMLLRKRKACSTRCYHFLSCQSLLTTCLGSKSTRCSTRNEVNWDNDQSIYNDKSVPNDGGTAESPLNLIICWKYKYDSILRIL